VKIISKQKIAQKRIINFPLCFSELQQSLIYQSCLPVASDGKYC
jgi:hypothetical protein